MSCRPWAAQFVGHRNPNSRREVDRPSNNSNRFQIVKLEIADLNFLRNVDRHQFGLSYQIPPNDLRDMVKQNLRGSTAFVLFSAS